MKRLAFPMLAMLALIACRENAPETAPAPPPSAGACDASKVQDVVGKPRSDALAEDARLRSGSKTVRYLTPDMVITMEFNGDRLNLHLGTDGKIGSARCG